MAADDGRPGSGACSGPGQPGQGEPTADELLEDAGRTYVYLELQGGRWYRRKEFVGVTWSEDMADSEFWVDRDRSRTLLAAVLRGNVAMVDNFELGDAPDFEPETAPVRQYVDLFNEYRDRVKTGAKTNRYTVYGVWQTDPSGTQARDGVQRPLKRFAKYVNAIDPVHAELIARAERQLGTCLIAGVVNKHVRPSELTEFTTYASEEGTTAPVVADGHSPVRTSSYRVPILVLAALVVVVIVVMILLL